MWWLYQRHDGIFFHRRCPLPSPSLSHTQHTENLFVRACVHINITRKHTNHKTLEGPVTCFADAAKSDTKKFGRWHRMMLERGVYLAPSQYEAGHYHLLTETSQSTRINFFKISNFEVLLFCLLGDIYNWTQLSCVSSLTVFIVFVYISVTNTNLTNHITCDPSYI